MAGASSTEFGAVIATHLQRVLASPGFASSPRMCRFLQFVVGRTLESRQDELKESVVGVSVFDRDPGYDPKSDAIVRVEARRLRTRLQEYYDGEGVSEPVRIILPKGTYVPELTIISGPAAAAPDPGTPVAITDVQSKDLAVRWPAIAAAGAISVVLIAAFFPALRQRTVAPSAASFRPFTALPGAETNPAFSPDGQTVAFIGLGPDSKSAEVLLQGVNEDHATPLTDTPENERGVAWSPDGKEIALFRSAGEGRMTLIVRPVAKGGEKTERQLGMVAEGSGTLAALQWSPDGRFLLAADSETKGSPYRIVRFWLPDGRREWITAPPVGSNGDSDPALSPDGATLAFRRGKSQDIEDLYLMALTPVGAEPRRLTNLNRGVRGHAWTPDGKALIASLQRSGNNMRLLWRVPVDGSEITRASELGFSAVQPAVAAKGGRLVWVTPLEDMNIWAVATDGKTPPRARILSTFFDMAPQYSPDGSRIVFRSNRSGVSAIWVCDRIGRDARKVVDFGGPQVSAPRWSPDGQRIVFEGRAGSSSDLFLLPMTGSEAPAKPAVFTNDSSQEVLPWWSRDGKWIYYASDQADGWQVWKRQADGAGIPVRVSKAGGFAPVESPDGKWIYYVRDANHQGLFRTPLGGAGAEEAVLPDFEGALWGNWVLFHETIYYFEGLAESQSPQRAVLKAMDLKTRATREVTRITRLPARFDTGLAISPDGREILFAQLDRSGSDLFLLEGLK